MINKLKMCFSWDSSIWILTGRIQIVLPDYTCLALFTTERFAELLIAENMVCGRCSLWSKRMIDIVLTLKVENVFARKTNDSFSIRFWDGSSFVLSCLLSLWHWKVIFCNYENASRYILSAILYGSWKSCRSDFSTQFGINSMCLSLLLSFQVRYDFV